MRFNEIVHIPKIGQNQNAEVQMFHIIPAVEGFNGYYSKVLGPDSRPFFCVSKPTARVRLSKFLRSYHTRVTDFR